MQLKDQNNNSQLNRSSELVQEQPDDGKKQVNLFDIDGADDIDQIKKARSATKEFGGRELTKNPSGEILRSESDMSADTNLPGFERVKDRIKNPRKMMKADFDSIFNDIVAKDKELERLTL